MDNKENNSPLSGERVEDRLYGLALAEYCTLSERDGFMYSIDNGCSLEKSNGFCAGFVNGFQTGYLHQQSRIAELEYKLTSLQVKHGELEAENAKMREALENIASATDGNNPGHAVFYFEARKVLQGKEAKDE